MSEKENKKNIYEWKDSFIWNGYKYSVSYKNVKLDNGEEVWISKPTLWQRIKNWWGRWKQSLN